MAKGHTEKPNEVGKDALVCPVVITHKSEGILKTALDSIELEKQIVKETMQLPFLSEILDQIYMKYSGNRKAELYISWLL